MKTQYLQPSVRTLTVRAEAVLMDSARGTASGQNLTLDQESDFDSFFNE